MTITGRGDFDLTSEYLDVFMETTTGTNLGSVFTSGVGQCSTTDAVATLNVPLATLQTAIADGSTNVVVRSTSSVSCGVCVAPNNFVRVMLTFPTSVSGTFTP